MKTGVGAAVVKSLRRNPGQSSKELTATLELSRSMLAYLVRVKIVFKAGPKPYRFFASKEAAECVDAMLHDSYRARAAGQQANRTKRWQEQNRDRYRELVNRSAQITRDTLGAPYVAKTLRMRTVDLTPQLMQMKQEQLTVRRLAQKLRKASNESSKDTDRILGKHGAGCNAGRSAEDRRQQPVGTGTQGDQCNRRRSNGEGTGLDQQ